MSSASAAGRDHSESKSFRLSPSDFSFLWEDCRRCFYMKVRNGLAPPKGPMPAMFTKIAGLQDRFFDGRRTEELVPQLPPGTFRYGEQKVCSAEFAPTGSASSCYIAGRFDSVVHFDDGSYGIIDFKTSETKSAHRANYGRQLHAYAHALENPAPGSFGLSPIALLGLLCLDVVEFGQGVKRNDLFYLRCNPVWVAIPRDNELFLGFIGEVLKILSSPTPPPSPPDCAVCKYTDKIRGLA